MFTVTIPAGLIIPPRVFLKFSQRVEKINKKNKGGWLLGHPPFFYSHTGLQIA
jgi:hypothetical protein